MDHFKNCICIRVNLKVVDVYEEALKSSFNSYKYIVHLSNEEFHSLIINLKCYYKIDFITLE